jgi:multicomponent Na+:H+ antiporter subunit F
MTLATLVLWVVLPAFALSLLLTSVRVARGPSLPDRIVALDLLGTLAIGVVAVLSIAYGKSVYLDVALVVALLSFLATVAFAVYLERSR